ncbi:hypothetical protein DPMN_187348 [Dreissena polymorpha]|uniref:Uncharacterized protein n=1 Tax=Dreissena polymorpha TaxID=45954 RepID=A0A9D4DRD9_DREPO|nr:hypothetical protein DPMN_187348 [Dreissena polymorpha]
MSPKTAPHLQYGVKDIRVRPEHDCNTCWSARALTGDRGLDTSPGTTLCARLFSRAR